jgi:hypothetical protein
MPETERSDPTFARNKTANDGAPQNKSAATRYSHGAAPQRDRFQAIS